MSRRKQPQSFPSGYYLAVSHHPLRLVTQPTTSSFGAAFRNRGHAAAPPTPRMWRAYQAILQHSTQLQLHSRRASRLSHEAVVSRTARKLASLRLPFCFLRNGATPFSPSSATQHVTHSPLHRHGSCIGLPHSAPWPTGRHTPKKPQTQMRCVQTSTLSPDRSRTNSHAMRNSKLDTYVIYVCCRQRDQKGRSASRHASAGPASTVTVMRTAHRRTSPSLQSRILGAILRPYTQ
jgi:hypothetical protein